MKILDFSERMPIGVRSNLHVAFVIDPIIGGSIIKGAAGLLGSLFGSKKQYDSTKETNATNLQIARETNQMQLDAMREQNAFNRDSAIEMFNMENAYNTPEAQRERLLNAGFNPAVAMSNGGVGASMASASAPTSAGLPNFVTPTMQTPPSVLLSSVDSISKLASAAADFSSAKKTSKETSWIDAEMDSQIKERFAQINNSEAQAAYYRTLDMIQNNFGEKKIAAEIANEYSQVYLNYLKGDTEQADASLKRFQAHIADITGKKEEKLMPIIIQEAQESVNLLKAKQETERSQQESNRASASLSRKQARIAELQGDAQEVLNEFLPERTINELTMQDLDIIDKIFSSGRANNMPNLVDMLVNRGVRKEIAQEVADAYVRRQKYLDRSKRYK